MLLFLALILFYRFGRDGRGGLRFRGVVGLHIGGGGGDSAPSLAGLTTDRYRYQDKAKQADRRFLCESFHNRSFFSCYVLFIIACIFFGKILQNKYKLYGGIISFAYRRNQCQRAHRRTWRPLQNR